MLQSGFCHVVSVHSSVRFASPRPVNVMLVVHPSASRPKTCHVRRKTHGYCGSWSVHTQLCLTRSWFEARLKSKLVRVSLHLYWTVP